MNCENCVDGGTISCEFDLVNNGTGLTLSVFDVTSEITISAGVSTLSVNVSAFNIDAEEQYFVSYRGMCHLRFGLSCEYVHHCCGGSCLSSLWFLQVKCLFQRFALTVPVVHPAGSASQPVVDLQLARVLLRLIWVLTPHCLHWIVVWLWTVIFRSRMTSAA